MVLQPVDPNEKFRLRRDNRRRRKRLRRVTAAVLVVAVVGAAAAAVVLLTRPSSTPAAAKAPARGHAVRPAVPHPRPLPPEVRGVHVTMSLASLPGRLAGYFDVPGLNTVELDVKDESGRVGFVRGAPKLARETGAAGAYYDPRTVVDLARQTGVYLIGRVVVFEDPIVSEKRPELAIRTTGGGIWHNRSGLGWANVYSRGYWDYVVSVAAAAARAGFDEIQLDYVRFPTDGDLSNAVFPGKRREAMGQTIVSFVRYVSVRLHPLHVRVSADVFGLSATRDLGIGQVPRKIAPYLDAVYPMVYPSHFNAGEYALPDPAAAPGLTVSRALADFRRQLRGRKTKLIPWLQDFSLGRTYSLADVEDQIAAARHQHTAGFMLWNAGGIYTDAALNG